MAQDVKLKIGADTSELERAFGTLIKKIQGDADRLKISPSGSKAAPGVESVREAAQTSRNLNQRIREEKAGLDLINRELAKKKALIDQISQQQANAVKGSREELALVQRLNRERERLHQAEKVAQIQKVNYDKAQEASNRARGIGGGQGGVAQGGITSLSGLAKALGIPLGAIGAGATAIAGGTALEGIRRYFTQANYRAAENQASAFQTQGQGGQRLNSLLNGGAAQELTFDPQRAQASQRADAYMKGELESSFRLFSRPLQTLFGKRRYTGSGLFKQSEQMGWGTAGTEAEVQSQQDKERAEFQSKQFEALKNGPEGAMRTAVSGSYLSNYQRDLDFQRQMGLNTGSFRGGFLGGVQGAGFTTEQGMGMASGIMGAGGSTRASVGSAALGLQAQRNLDITNASGVLGKLSGSLGSSETTNEAFVKLLAEGTRVGLDGSDFREENRKFVESAADIVSKSGVTSSGGIDQILSQFGRFFSDKSNVGIEAGKSAYELYRQTSMETTGPRGTMRAAGMLTDPTINKLGRDSREALFNMPIDQLTPDNPAIIAMAKQAGVSPQTLIDAQNGITSRSANQFTRSDQATQRLAAVKNKYGRSSVSDTVGPFAPGEQDELNTALGESNIAQIKEHPELGQNQRMTSAYSEALSKGDAQAQNKILEDAKKQQLSATGTGRPEDETNRAQAEASRLANQLFLSIKDSIIPASDAVKSFANDINTLVAAIRSGQGASALQNFNAKYPGMSSMNAPTAGSPSSGGGSGR